MSTRGSIFYRNGKKDYHIYVEMLDDTVHVETRRAGVTANIEVMTAKKWRALGLPTTHTDAMETGRLQSLCESFRVQGGKQAQELAHLRGLIGEMKTALKDVMLDYQLATGYKPKKEYFALLQKSTNTLYPLREATHEE